MTARYERFRKELPTRAESRSALRLLREGRWVQALLGVVLLTVVFTFLGRWQWHRHVHRDAEQALVNRNYSATPRPLQTLLPAASHGPGSTLPHRLEWRQTVVTGSYLLQQQVLVRNRPYEEQAGYDVVVPLQATDGTVVFVDRGWIPAGPTAERPSSVPTPPSGQVRVVIRLRPSEPVEHKQAPAGQVQSIVVPRLARTLPDPARVVGAYGGLVSEDPAATGAGQPQPLLPPDFGIGINFAYALQWWAFALAGYGMFGWAMVREVRRRADAGISDAVQ